VQRRPPVAPAGVSRQHIVDLCRAVTALHAGGTHVGCAGGRGAAAVAAASADAGSAAQSAAESCCCGPDRDGPEGRWRWLGRTWSDAVVFGAGFGRVWLQEWASLLEGRFPSSCRPDVVDPRSRELRQNTPFAGCSPKTSGSVCSLGSRRRPPRMRRPELAHLLRAARHRRGPGHPGHREPSHPWQLLGGRPT